MNRRKRNCGSSAAAQALRRKVQPIDIEVSTLHGFKHTESMPAEASILQLKSRLADVVGVHVTEQRLVCNDKVMADDEKLHEYLDSSFQIALKVSLIKVRLPCIIVLGGDHYCGLSDGPDGSPSTAESFSLLHSSWSSLGCMPSPRAEFAAAVLDGMLFVTGGHLASALGGQSLAQPLSSAAGFDPVRNEWFDLPSMIVPRIGHAMVAMGQHLFVFGGGPRSRWHGLGTNQAGIVFGDEPPHSVNSAEIYDFASQNWSTLPPMSGPRRNLAAVQLHDQLYVLGGWLGGIHHDSLDTVEVFDPVRSTWRNGQSMLVSRSCFSAVELNSNIYALGGMHHGEPAMHCEVFPSEQGTWVELPEMIFDREGHCAVSVANKIYVMGGSSVGCNAHFRRQLSDGSLADVKESFTSAHVEMLDIVANEWIAVPNMLAERHDDVCAAVV